MSRIFALKDSKENVKGIFLNVYGTNPGRSSDIVCTISCWESAEDVFWAKVNYDEINFKDDLATMRSGIKPFFTICKDQYRYQRLGKQAAGRLWRDQPCSEPNPVQTRPLNGFFDQQFAWLVPDCYKNGNVCLAHGSVNRRMSPNFYLNKIDFDGDLSGTIKNLPIWANGAVDGYDTVDLPLR
ncbi:Oidioi.mRNA.OKI2018_I69.XSR.g16502.t1.cds [Oikopleura dioica]|uniref:Oidioi.mRNA.OKI2018_I69.XSR.g16502.t1.cds n=1 Tax=Oikopleura dioica TaxID=34765 RepID=A0ABN7SKB4_OIKDI|nr:Oidioi.mRNA.OKI2018_I69.XSR.g16502.t1.cds [Oikopleura dioica]